MHFKGPRALVLTLPEGTGLTPGLWSLPNQGLGCPPYPGLWEEVSFRVRDTAAAPGLGFLLILLRSNSFSCCPSDIPMDSQSKPFCFYR